MNISIIHSNIHSSKHQLSQLEVKSKTSNRQIKDKLRDNKENSHI